MLETYRDVVSIAFIGMRKNSVVLWFLFLEKVENSSS